MDEMDDEESGERGRPRGMRPGDQDFCNFRKEAEGFKDMKERRFGLVERRPGSRFKLMAGDANDASLPGTRFFPLMKVEGNGPSGRQEDQNDE
jgi:hypothetical protein